MDFNDLFDRYDELGYKVVPIKPGLKHPGYPEWEDKEFAFGTMFRKWGIGIRCGKESGIIAVDIDLESSLDLVPPSPVRKKGNKGETRFFKYNGELPRKRHDIGIEIFSGDRCQVVLPPTMHPDSGKPYVWTTPDTLLSYNKNDLPILPKEFIDLIYNGKKETSNFLAVGGRHNKLVSMSLAMHAKGKGVQEIAQELFEYDRDNHAPPYFSDKTESHGGKGLESAINMAVNTAKTAIDNKFIAPQEVIIGPSIIEEEIEEEFNPELPPLPKLSGLTQEFFNYIYSNSPIPRSRFCWASSMALMSVLVGNRYSFMGTHPNLIMLLLAPTGFGKDAPLKSITALLFDAGLDPFIGQSDYASDIGIVAGFPNQRKRIDVIDEAALLFKASHTLPPNRQNIIHALSKVWSGVGKIYEGRTRQKDLDEGKIAYRGRCYSPFLSLVAATTFTGIEDNFDRTVLETGLGGRTIYFPEERYKKNKIFTGRSEVSYQLKRGLELWAGPKIDVPNPNALEKFPITDLGVGDLKRYTEIWEALLVFKESQAINLAAPIYQRAIETFNKFCLLHHCSLSNEVNLTILNESLDWAYNATLTILKYGDYVINRYTCNSSMARLSNKIYDIILQKKGKGMTKTELVQKTRRLVSRPQEREEALSELINSNKITAELIPSKTRSTYLYTAKSYLTHSVNKCTISVRPVHLFE